MKASPEKLARLMQAADAARARVSGYSPAKRRLLQLRAHRAMMRTAPPPRRLSNRGR